VGGMDGPVHRSSPTGVVRHGSAREAHPNSRYHAAHQCPSISALGRSARCPHFGHHFGGRRWSRHWYTNPLTGNMGVYGRRHASATAAAGLWVWSARSGGDATFCGYNMADYFGHWQGGAKHASAARFSNQLVPYGRRAFLWRVWTKRAGAEMDLSGCAAVARLLKPPLVGFRPQTVSSRGLDLPPARSKNCCGSIVPIRAGDRLATEVLRAVWFAPAT
jgi:hypothetical protein